MRYYDELSFEQISQITGDKVSTLKTNYHYAVQKVKESVSVIEIGEEI
jgi:RNA polymerase sigma-70 factor (ECF subfamily)